ncbi:hypothetical protein DM860_000940 [Cuscuta australis]|uniref:Exocyst complex subunit EXOC6/Sec15 C-terminal domain-containing protein n=1 Tax=Cuscuta australis TaxID=267555 RepID=A0A328DTJ7_9ASTE|nr:hypothetical protein DM860_000940 [Cuscuta australis]
MPLFSCPGIAYNHEFKTKRRTSTENGDMIEETVLVTLINNGDDLGLLYPSLNNHVEKIRVIIEAGILLIKSEYLDIDVLNEAILDMIHSGTTGVSQAMQASDYFLQPQQCGIPVCSVEIPQGSLTAKTILKKLQLDEFTSLAENVNWTVKDAPQEGNEHINDVLIYLDTLMSTVQQISPLNALYKVWSGALEHISNSISWHQWGFEGNEASADEKFHSTGLSEIYGEGSF